ncbi:N-acetylglucosamine transferase, partial [Pseudomonas sp. HMWF010]
MFEMTMADPDVLAVLAKITAGEFSLSDLINAAGSLAGQGQAGLAEQVYKVWIQFNPDHPQLFIAHFNCASLNVSGPEAAAAHLERAIALNADFLPAYINLGGLRERSGQLEAAIGIWNEGASRPMALTGANAGYAFGAMKQIARALLEVQQSHRAETALWRCADLDPSQTDTIGQLVAVRLSQCKWPPVAPWERVDRRTLLLGFHPLSMAAYTDDPWLQLSAAARFTAREAGSNPDAIIVERRDAPIDLTGRRLKVGYISSD